MKKIIIGVIAVLVIIAAGASYFLGWLPGTQKSSQSTSSTTLSSTLPSNINFKLTPRYMKGSGLARTISYKLTNEGSADAHNVWAKIEILLEGTAINLGGDNYYLRDDIGLIKAGEEVRREVDVKFTLTDGLNLLKKGGTLKVTVNTDEGTQVLSYYYDPYSPTPTSSPSSSP